MQITRKGSISSLNAKTVIRARCGLPKAPLACKGGEVGAKTHPVAMTTTARASILVPLPTPLT